MAFWEDAPEQTIELIEEAWHFHPEHPDLWFRKARALNQKGKRTQAVDELESLLDTHPDHESAQGLYESINTNL